MQTSVKEFGKYEQRVWKTQARGATEGYAHKKITCRLQREKVR